MADYQSNDEILPEEEDVGQVGYPRLTIVAGPQTGRSFGLRAGEQVLGRGKDTPVHLDDTSVSRHHAKITLQGDAIYASDLGSRHGTFLNGIRIRQDSPLNHLDQIKVGIYTLSYLKEEVTEEELLRAAARFQQKPPPPQPIPKVELEHEEKTEKESLEDPQTAKDEVDQEMALVSRPYQVEPDEVLGKRIRNVFFILCGIAATLALAATWYSRSKSSGFNMPPVEPLQVVAPKQDLPPPTEKEPTIKGLSPSSGERTLGSAPPLATYPAFLDVEAKPTNARISFQGSYLGLTPLKARVDLNLGQEYEVVAEYELEDIKDRYQKKIKFTPIAGQEVIPIKFDADIGMIKVIKLPRSVQFYLEGYYAHDKNRANPVRLDNIIYGKPIYVPFGDYVIELRENNRVGDSDTFVNEIRYHRKFVLDQERRSIELSITDKDLQFFQATIGTEPQGADLYLDGTKIGTTPFLGEMPLGRHELKILREGFFEYIETLEMRVNTPFEKTVVLKTSKVGEMVNMAMGYHQTAQHSSAITKLVEALKYGPSERERAQIHLLLGDSYYMLGDYSNSGTYFNLALSHEDFSLRARLGLARTDFKLKNSDSGMRHLVEVLLKVPDGTPLSSQAKNLFQEVSGVHSVLYIATQPPGATVIVNKHEATQKTPVILADLDFANYTIEVVKAGYLPQKIKKNLKVGEFVPIIVELVQEKL